MNKYKIGACWETFKFDNSLKLKIWLVDDDIETWYWAVYDKNGNRTEKGIATNRQNAIEFCHIASLHFSEYDKNIPRNRFKRSEDCFETI